MKHTRKERNVTAAMKPADEHKDRNESGPSRPTSERMSHAAVQPHRSEPSR